MEILGQHEVLDGALAGRDGVLRALLGLLGAAGGEGGLGIPPIIADAPLQCLFEQEVFLFNSWEQSLKSERHGLNAISTCPTDMDSLALHLRLPSLSWR